MLDPLFLFPLPLRCRPSRLIGPQFRGFPQSPAISITEESKAVLLIANLVICTMAAEALNQTSFLVLLAIV